MVFQSTIKINNQPIPSHAFALAADEYAAHGVCDLTGLGESRIGSMPFGVIGVVAGGASFAMAALAAGGAMQDDLVGAGDPVFVDEEFDGFRRGTGGFGDQSDVGRNPLQF